MSIWVFKESNSLFFYVFPEVDFLDKKWMFGTVCKPKSIDGYTKREKKYPYDRHPMLVIQLKCSYT